MAYKDPRVLANQIQRPQVNFSNRNEFLRKYGLDKYYEFDGGDLWNINYDDDDKDIADYPMTGIRVGYGGTPWDEEALLQEIEKLGRWKRPDPTAKKLKDAGRSDERIADAEKGIKEKHPEKLLGSKSKFAAKYPDRYAKLQSSKFYGEGRTAEDVDWDEIAGILGIDLG